MDINLYALVGKKKKNVTFANWLTTSSVYSPCWKFLGEKEYMRPSLVGSMTEMSNIPLLSVILEPVVVGKKYSLHTCLLLREYLFNTRNV